MASSNKNIDEQVNKVMEIISLTLKAQFFNGSNGVSYISIEENEKLKTLPIKSQLTRDYFHAFLRKNGFKVSRHLLDAIFDEFKSCAVVNDQMRDIYIRIGSLNGATIVDSGDKDYHFTVIDETGYRTTQSVPIHFVRPAKQRPLPIPQAMNPAKFAEIFRSFCRFKDPNAWMLVLSALLLFLRRGSGAYPIIVLEGPQGSGKTSLSGFLRKLIDPCDPSLTQPPKNSEDIMILSNSGYVLSFDNLSGINDDMADIFCRVSTGAGISKRVLYTDDDEKTYYIHNPMILNGIDEPSAKADFVQRCLMIELNPLDSGSLKPESELRLEFEKVYPNLLGGLYQTLSECLRILPQIDSAPVSRMGDYSLMGMALERVLDLPPNFFEDIYAASIDEQTENAFWTNALCCSIYEKLNPKSTYGGATRKDIQGTATELMSKLYGRDPSGGGLSSSRPKGPKSFTDHLKRAEPLLAAKGIVVERWRVGGRREILIRKLYEDTAAELLKTTGEEIEL